MFKNNIARDQKAYNPYMSSLYISRYTKKRIMFSRTKRGILTGLSALLFSCGGSPLERATIPKNDTAEESTNPTTDSTEERTDSYFISQLPFPGKQPHPRAESKEDIISYLPSFDTTENTSSDSSQDTESDKWVKVGDDHHQKWCPPETPVYVAGKCTTLEDVICTDSDKTEALFKKSAFGDYFEKTIANSDPSLGLGGTVTFSTLSDPTVQELSPDLCKSTQILEEYYCSEGIATTKAIKCNEYLPKSTCVVNEQGQGFCQPEDLCPTLPGIQPTLVYDNDKNGVAESCIEDLCQSIPEIQSSFLYDNDKDGIAESCELDLCSLIPGIQTSLIYDNNGDGVNDSCEALDVCLTIEGTQTDFLFDTDNDGKKDSCVPDYCPEQPGVQEDFPYDNDNDGILESCLLDLCPTIPGIQDTYSYDNDWNGVPESCEPIDVCPLIEGTQTVLLYDTDNDGINDSCTPDFCPELPGVQSALPYDNDQDGINESCIKDFCPDTLVPGIQSEFLYDVDKDGVKESCVPVDKDFCSDPDPQKTYPNATLYSYSDQWHMGFCLDGNGSSDTILHVICSEDGTWHTDITECKLDMPCVQGACAECSDSDGTNFDEKGYVLWLEKDGTIGSKKDYCLSSNENDYRTDFVCKGTTWDITFEACPTGQKCLEDIVDGKATLSCIPGIPPVCEDSDGTYNFESVGTTTGFTKEGDAYSHNDFCLSTISADTIIDFYCEGGISKSSYFWCDPTEICKEEIESVDGKVVGTLKCIPAPAKPTCEDFDGTENYPQKSYVSGMDKHGKSYTHNDYCVNGGQLQGIIDWKCNEYNIPQSNFYLCESNELCKEVPTTENDQTNTTLACIPSCIDLDPDNNPAIAGTVYDFNNVPYPDVCEGNILYQYECTPLTGEKMEAGIINCANGCDGGMCK